MQKLKGLWIPAEILLNKDLSDKEKIILSMILYLSEETKSCFASNKYIASIVNVTANRVSKIISSLKDKEYIKVKLKYKTDSKEIEQRQITPIVENINRYNSKSQEGIGTNNYLDSQNQLYPIYDKDKDISKFSIKRDEKIFEEIIKPKDELINELYQNNLLMHQQLLRQTKIIEEAEKYQIERNNIMADNRYLHKQIDDIKAEYKQKEDNLEWKYKYRINKLEKENRYLHNVIYKFRETIHKFIEWICVNFNMGAGDTLIRDFKRKTRTCLDGEEQIKREEREKNMKLEL